MRLGDLDALKKHKFTTQIANGVELEDIDVVPVTAIDNAPTVEEVSIVEFKEPLPPVKAHKIIRALNKRPQGDLISREALLKEVRENKELYEKERVYLEGLLLNAPTVEPELSDEQIEKIADLLEIEWGYEGIREDVSRILRGGAE